MGELLVAGLVLVVMCGVWISFPRVRSQNLGSEASPRRPRDDLERAPRVHAGAVAENAVSKVVVSLARSPMLESPLGRVPCVAWKLELALPSGSLALDGLESTDLSSLRGIEDTVEVVLASDCITAISWPDPTPWAEMSPHEHAAVLAEAGIHLPPDIGDRLRWRESRLLSTDCVAILGRARWRTREAPEYRAAARELELGDRGELPLLVSARAEHMR